MPQYPVIIIGAGIAGIRAAQILSRHGVPNLILEAKDYIGGRMHSVRHQNTWLELGASWLHGYHQHPLRNLVKKVGLSVAFTDYNDAHKFPGVGTNNQWHSQLQAAARRAAKAPRDAPLQSFMAGLDDALKPIITLETEMYYGATLEKLSGWNFDDGGEPEADDFLLLGGWANFLETQLKGLTLRLNTPVQAVRPTIQGLKIQTTLGETLPARAVINTMPLGVLQQANAAAVLPELPSAHAQAIAKLGMGNLEKLFFTAPFPSWPRHDVMVVNHPLLPLWYDATPLLGTPTLMALAGMSALAALPANPSQADWLQLAIPALRQLVPTGPLPTLVKHSAWHADPFTHGSYSYYAVGSSPADRRALQKPWFNNRYWLAGEHTDMAFPANIQGAWRSGERAAKALLKAL
jgi:monoamine oxidase